jgi:transcription-repair coupling factor (superfamily II helicase)
MFESIRIYKSQRLDIEEFLASLYSYGYERVGRVSGVGDFDRRGGAISLFPITFGDPIRLELKNDIIEKIRSYDLESGKPIEEHGMAIVLPIKGIYKKRIKTPVAKLAERSPIDSFVDIEVNDRVVHVEHGIGVYKGIERHKVGGKIIDHIVIEYAEGGKLYVPFSELNLIQKYIGYEKKPKIHKLGSRIWKRTKTMAQRGINNLALELLEITAKRESRKGFSFSPDANWQKELEKDFPFEETADQARSTIEVKKDMQEPRPMDRLICGDVGYGKTEIAIRAAFKAVMDNKQVAILVPTTILAEQHYTTFCSRMRKYPVNIAMLSRFKSKSEQTSILRELAKGRIDIIIGTHRLFSSDVSFKDLGLVVIDEEQRFGVRHKESLKQLRLMTDVLTMTATPIPRTLYMSLMGARDMSQLETPPQNRLPIKTVVSGYDAKMIKNANKARIGVAHGALPSKALEEAMLKFIEGETDILVSTTIVESGIDIPNANTIIINNADRFGLADLYQLRGRVGRFKRQAFAYLLISKSGAFSSKAERRLMAIHKFTELGAGFKVAMKDLEIRGAGNILGTEQHGYINSIGFDLYCRLLRGAIDAYKKTLRGN